MSSTVASRAATSPGTMARRSTGCRRCNWRCVNTSICTRAAHLTMTRPKRPASRPCCGPLLKAPWPPAGVSMQSETKKFFAACAWVQGAWARDVLLTVDGGGRWCGVQADAPPADRLGATVLGGPVLPGLVNAHSHAFQRAMAGLAEYRAGAGSASSDDFWSWRDRMYSVARRVTPEQLESIAAFLYAELLAGGYTQVCEFHYLHNAADGQVHANPLEMSLALVRAARRV